MEGGGSGRMGKVTIKRVEWRGGVVVGWGWSRRRGLVTLSLYERLFHV